MRISVAGGTSATASPDRIGVWLIGARGSVGIITAVGVTALAHGLTGRTGCVTVTADLAGLPLVTLHDWVLGGHDVTMTPVRVRADQLAAGTMFPVSSVAASGAGLNRFEEEIRPGVASGERTPRAEILDGLVDDLVSHAEGFLGSRALPQSSSQPVPAMQAAR